MLTYNTKAKVTKDHKLEVRLPTDLDEGEYTVLIQVSQPPAPRAPCTPLTFGSLHLGTMQGSTFHREEIYGDDGR